MDTIPVDFEKDEELSRRMAALGINESDIEEVFVRSAGHGGQNVNKTSTCVMLIHRPTGLQVKCQTTRQQGRNRVIAWRLLLDKIEKTRKQRVDQERDRVEKQRRANRPRSKRAKQRILSDKRLHSAKIKQRRHIERE